MEQGSLSGIGAAQKHVKIPIHNEIFMLNITCFNRRTTEGEDSCRAVVVAASRLVCIRDSTWNLSKNAMQQYFMFYISCIECRDQLNVIQY